MPFDGATFPSLQSLSNTLPARSRWPAGFEWDYGHCRSGYGVEAMGGDARLSTSSTNQIGGRGSTNATAAMRRSGRIPW
jgi:hypothetical protein